LIEEVFKCKVYNQYASSEGAPFITECKYGNYHLLLHTGLIHKVENFHGVAITSFRNSIIPLVKYFIGDVILFKEDGFFNNKKCACGTLMPVISEIIGRQEDTIKTKSKGNIERLDPVFKGLQGILNSQIIQKRDGRINVLVEMRSGVEVQKVTKGLSNNLKAVLGDDMDIFISVVRNIPKGANGKFKAVISECKFDL
jgi:phenylacetate-CoA ligase